MYSETTKEDLPFDFEAVSSMTLSAVLDSSNNLRAALFVSASFSNLGDQKYGLYVFTINASLSTDEKEQFFSYLKPQTYIDFGIDPDVRLISNNGTIFLLEVSVNFSLAFFDTYKTFVPFIFIAITYAY